MIGDGESAFDMLNLSTHRPETPPPRMRLSVSKMSLSKERIYDYSAPRTLPKVYGGRRHLSELEYQRFDGVDILKLYNGIRKKKSEVR